MQTQRLIEPVITAAARAGGEILDVARSKVETREKADTSPVTEADERAEATILKALRALTPEALVIAEERADAAGLPETVSGPFWLVDPLDGTKEFLKGGSDYTVNIALIEDGQPILGVVYCPADGRLFLGDTENGAWRARMDESGNLRERESIRTRPAATPLTVVASKSHSNPDTQAYLANYPGADCVSIGSSLKFCLVAQGEADLYPRLGPTMEWDTAAGHGVLRAAGGCMVDSAGARFRYYKPGFRNGHFLAWGDPALTPVPLPEAASSAPA